MWRAFFYAVGITLILLGTQCLFVDQFLVGDSTRVPSAVIKLVSKFNGQSTPKTQPNLANPFGHPNGNQNGAGSVFQQAGYPYSQPRSANGSQFGPSRFDNSPFGSGSMPNMRQSQYYGGVPTNQRANPQFSLAEFGQPQNNANFPQPNTQDNGSKNVFGKAIKSRLIKTQDWMPWSLLAAGTLVVLYTRSTARGYSGE